MSTEIEGNRVYLDNCLCKNTFPFAYTKNGALSASSMGSAFQKLLYEPLICIDILNKMLQDILVPVVKARVCSGQPVSS